MFRWFWRICPHPYYGGRIKIDFEAECLRCGRSHGWHYRKTLDRWRKP